MPDPSAPLDPLAVSGPSSQPPDPRATPALYRLAALATRVDDTQAALRAVLESLVATFRADAGSLSLLNPSTERLETAVRVGTFTDPAAAHELRRGHGVTGWCVLNQRSLLVPDVSVEPRYIAVRGSARCEMAAPIWIGEQVIGAIDLESDRVGGFTPADLALLERLAVESARVMQRLWELGHLRAKARQLESLITAGQSFVTKLEPREVFDTLTREARHMLSARACALYLYDSARRTVRCASFHSEPPAIPPGGEFDLESCLVASPIHTRRQIWFSEIQSPEYRELSDLPADRSLHSVLATPLVLEREVLGVIAVFTDRPHRFDNDEKRLCSALAGLGSVALQNARLYSRVFESEDTVRKNERLTTLGLLAAEIAHEIRNPLTVLKLLYGGLGLDFPEGDPRRTDQRVIGEKLDQLEAIVGRVLNFAQAPSGLHSRWRLAEIVEDTLVLVRLKLGQHKVAVSFAPPPRPLFVDVQKGQIQQVLLNLLFNAMHAMPDGGTIRLAIITEECEGASQVCLDLTDSGTGVPAAIRDRIFDSFLSGRPDGTGLGLAIAKRILVAHHGDIRLLATGPSGTTMRLTLPLAR